MNLTFSAQALPHQASGKKTKATPTPSFKGELTSPQFSGKPKKMGRIGASVLASLSLLLAACGNNRSVEKAQENLQECIDGAESIIANEQANCDPYDLLYESLLDDNDELVAFSIDKLMTLSDRYATPDQKVAIALWALTGARQSDEIEDAGIRAMQTLLDTENLDPETADLFRDTIDNQPFTQPHSSLRWKKGYNDTYVAYYIQHCSGTGSNRTCWQQPVYQTRWIEGRLVTQRWETREYPERLQTILDQLYQNVTAQQGDR